MPLMELGARVARMQPQNRRKNRCCTNAEPANCMHFLFFKLKLHKLMLLYPYEKIHTQSN